MVSTSRLAFGPLPLPATANAAKLSTFGRLVTGYSPSTVTPQELEEIQENLFKFGILVFRGVELTPKEQYELTKVSAAQAEQ